MGDILLPAWILTLMVSGATGAAAALVAWGTMRAEIRALHGHIERLYHLTEYLTERLDHYAGR